MNVRNLINKTVTLRIHQPLGSKHPICNIFYPLNYGYIPTGFCSKKYKAYVLGLYEPVEIFEGTCIAVIHNLHNSNDKLVVVPNGKYYTDDQIIALTEFQEANCEYIILR